MKGLASGQAFDVGFQLLDFYPVLSLSFLVCSLENPVNADLVKRLGTLADVVYKLVDQVEKLQDRWK